MQPSQDGGGNGRRVGEGFRPWCLVQKREHPSKVAEDAAALEALRRVTL
jgi:hypothetical protein